MQRIHPKNIQSLDLYQTKVTPRTRPAHEAGHDGQLINADPAKKYVLVPRDENHPMGVQYYEAMGYELEICTPDGVKIRMGEPVKPGSPLGWRGHALMSCSKARADEIFEFGPTGNTGQRYFDQLMQKIRKDPTSKKPHEHVRGLREEYDINDPDADLANNQFR